MDKAGLKLDIKDMLDSLKEAPDQEAAIEEYAEKLTNAIDKFVKTAEIVAIPADVVTATMSNSGGPVVAAANLNSTIS